jgi:hypothetical protein
LAIGDFGHAPTLAPIPPVFLTANSILFYLKILLNFLLRIIHGGIKEFFYIKFGYLIPLLACFTEQFLAYLIKITELLEGKILTYFEAILILET